jgi:formate hydrogenlyase transcriptional activator
VSIFAPEFRFIKLKCAAIPTGLWRVNFLDMSEAHSRARSTLKIGRLELADQGSLFLDEVGDIPLEIQPKLLRALQEREFERLGSTHTKKVNVRLVAATNRNLEKMIQNREFRSDLYWRFRLSDSHSTFAWTPRRHSPVSALFHAEVCPTHGKTDRIDSYRRHEETFTWHWPGNIRELENFIERSVILTHTTALQLAVGEIGSNGVAVPAGGSRQAKDRDEILHILKQTQRRVAGPQGAAARMGIKRTTLISRMKKLGIDPRRISEVWNSPTPLERPTSARPWALTGTLTPDMLEASGKVARLAPNGSRSSKSSFVSYWKDGGRYSIRN